MSDEIAARAEQLRRQRVPFVHARVVLAEKPTSAHPGDEAIVLPDGSMEVPTFELGETVTPSPHHPLGVKGVGESATVGSPPAVVNAVLDALQPLGVKAADMPLTPAQVWLTIQGRPARTDLAFT